MPKQYIGISRDHSMSMTSLRNSAMKDYNLQIQTLKDASQKYKIDTIVSVVNCGDVDGNRFNNHGVVKRDIVNSSVQFLEPLTQYHTPGGSTPLFDSVKELIDILKAVPDANDKNVSFLVQVITDGEENSSRNATGYSLAAEISKLQATDKWTFTFRVPKGKKHGLTRLGIPAGNIIEWELTDEGMEYATLATTQAYDTYYNNVSRGTTSTKSFYSDLSHVSSATVKKNLHDITSQLQIFSADKVDEAVNKFMLRKTGQPLVKGTAFFELTKPEKAVQDYKKIVIQDLKKGGFYTGSQARKLLGLPEHGTVRITPGDHAHYKIYLQSTSVNRKIKKGTSVLYWNQV